MIITFLKIVKCSDIRHSRETMYLRPGWYLRRSVHCVMKGLFENGSFSYTLFKWSLMHVCHFEFSFFAFLLLTVGQISSNFKKLFCIVYLRDDRFEGYSYLGNFIEFQCSWRSVYETLSLCRRFLQKVNHRRIANW